MSNATGLQASAQEVLVFALGPVQGFIQAARKSQDYWAGSALLSELARSAAKAVEQHARSVGGRLVYPPLGGPRQPIANKLCAVLPAGSGETAAQLAGAAAQGALVEICERVRSGQLQGLGLDWTAWSMQLDRFPEIYWAVVPLAGLSYQEARRLAEEMLDGRKRLRDFSPYVGIVGRLKSSLDGQFESVYDGGGLAQLRGRFGPVMFGTNELLDALGLLRRLWRPPGHNSWLSVAGVAVAPFLHALAEHLPGSWQRVEEARRQLRQALRGALGAADEARLLDEDGSDLLVSSQARRRAVAREVQNRTAAPNRPAGITAPIQPDPGKLPDSIRRALQEYDRGLERLLGQAKDQGLTPSPYLAIVAADGDGIGSQIDQLSSPEQHARLSQALAGFARQVLALERSFPEDEVQVLYAGGDDLLAVVSLDQALPFAQRLQEEFAQALAEVRELVAAPSLSVGIAIVHAHDQFGSNIALARKAERAAKDAGGNALAILLSKRSGGDRLAVLPWADQPVARLYELANLLRDFEAPHGLAYELERTGAALNTVEPETLAHEELHRVLRRKRARRGTAEVDSQQLRSLLEAHLGTRPVAGRSLSARLQQFVDQLVVALHLAAHVQPGALQRAGTPADGGQP